MFQQFTRLLDEDLEGVCVVLVAGREDIDDGDEPVITDVADGDEAFLATIVRGIVSSLRGVTGAGVVGWSIAYISVGSTPPLSARAISLIQPEWKEW